MNILELILIINLIGTIILRKTLMDYGNFIWSPE